MSFSFKTFKSVAKGFKVLSRYKYVNTFKKLKHMKKLSLPIIFFVLFLSIPSYAGEVDNLVKVNKINKRIEKIDKDNDGLISKKELIDAHRFRINKIFYNYDKNYDGKLSKKEFKASRKGMKKRFGKIMKCEQKNG